MPCDVTRTFALEGLLFRSHSTNAPQAYVISTSDCLYLSQKIKFVLKLRCSAKPCTLFLLGIIWVLIYFLSIPKG